MTKTEVCEALERAAIAAEENYRGTDETSGWLKEAALLRTLKERIERGQEGPWGGYLTLDKTQIQWIDRPILVIDWS